jgi:hypothetical protein
VKSWLLSTLRAGSVAKGRDAFLAANPGCWLLWEPGSWKPPQSRTMIMTVAMKPVPEPARVAVPAPTAEALAISLVPLAHPVVLGRSDDCDLPLNDATLSGHHLAFHPSGPSWSVEDVGSTNGTRVNGVTLAPNARLALGAGAKIEAGQVRLTFVTPEALWARLAPT